MRALMILIVLALGAALIGATFALSGRDLNARRTVLEREARTIQTRAGPQRYARAGQGLPILVIHGAGGGFDQGLLIAQTFVGDGFDIIAPSRFGYLGSALPSDASTQAQADAFIDLIDRLQLDRVSVVGFSGGTPPALQLALRYPQRVRCLALLSSAPFTPHAPPQSTRPMPDWAYQTLLGNDQLYWLMTKLARGALEEAFDAGAERPREAAEATMIAQLVEGFSPASERSAGLANEAAAIAPQTSYAIERIGAPTLVIHARDDRINSFALGENIAERIPGARFIAYDEGGHLLLAHQAHVRQELGAFLGGCGAP